MRRFIPALCVVMVASTAMAEVYAPVYYTNEQPPLPQPDPNVSAMVFRADEQTLLPWVDPNVPDVYRDIMVGTRLTIFIVSDANGPWGGHLASPLDEWPVGAVSGRDRDPETRGYEGSSLPAVDERTAYVDDYFTADGVGLKFNCNAYAVAGDWFVVDYQAKAVGTCDMGLYTTNGPSHDPYGEDPQPPGELDPVQILSFRHVPSRDFRPDNGVDFADFALFAKQWRAPALDPNQVAVNATTDPNTPWYSDPNTPFPPTPITPPSPDLNADNQVDTDDLALFCAYWLERTDVNQPPAPDPNAPETEQ